MPTPIRAENESPETSPEATRPTPVAEHTRPVSPVPAASATPTPATGAVVYPAQSAGQPPVPPDLLVAEDAPVPRRNHRWPWVLLGIFLVLLFGGIGTFLGYRSGLNMRVEAERSNRTLVATEHFMLGMQAQDNKQWEMAKQQYEAVMRLDPNFPGASDKLREVLIAQMQIATPTAMLPTPTPTPEPTEDLRPLEDIYNQAAAQYAAQDWDGVFASIDSLRTNDPTYRAADVDGMLYFALRFRGIDKILMRANLEGGLYDLALAERYGPLDVDAKNYRLWARQYLNGTRFWGIDWLKVMEYFEDIYLSFPNLRDGSGLPAIERYRIAAYEHANRLAAQGQYCEAEEFYAKSLAVAPDGAVQATATAVYELCATPTPEVVPYTATPTVTLSPTVDPLLPTITPTPEVVVPPPDATATTAPPVEPTAEPSPTP